MARFNEVHDIIVPATAPNFTAHTYSEIYGGVSGCTITLNGVVVNMAAQSSISLWVRSVSNGTGCYLLGTYQDVYLGSPKLP
jgi:hypothetical protein